MDHLSAATSLAQSAQPFYTVCKRVISADPAYSPRTEYRGKTIYFCTESCLDAFVADPERFYFAHSRPRKRCKNDKFYRYFIGAI
jgi:YHS domain-containing protein